MESVCIDYLFCFFDVKNSSGSDHSGWMFFQILRKAEPVSFEKHSQIIKDSFVFSYQKGIGLSLHASSSRSSRPVYKLADIFRSIVVDDSIDSFHIQSSSCQISSY